MRGAPVVLLLALAAGTAAGVEVQDSFTLDLPGGPASRIDAVGDASAIHLVWTRAADGTLHYGRIDVDGPRWSWSASPRLGNLTPPPVGSFARLGVLAGDVFVVWQEQGTTNQDIDLRLARVGGNGSAHDAEDLLDDAGRQILPAVACTASACAAAWSEESTPNAGDWRVVGARIAPDVGPRVRLSDNPSGVVADFPALATLDDGRFLVAWADRRGGAGQEIRVATWDAASGDVSASARASPENASGIRTGPSVVVRGHEWVLAWVDAADASHRGLAAATSTDAGRSWTGLDVAAWTVQASDVQHPSVFLTPARGLAVAWEDGRWGLPQVVMAQERAEADWAVAPLAAGEGTTRQSTPRHVSLAGDLHLFVLEQEGDERRVVVHSTAGGIAVDAVGSVPRSAQSAGPAAAGAALALLGCAWTLRRPQ